MSEVAYKAKELAAKPDDLTSNPRTQIAKRGTNSRRQLPDLYMFATAYACPPKHIHKHREEERRKREREKKGGHAC